MLLYSGELSLIYLFGANCYFDPFELPLFKAGEDYGTTIERDTF